MNNEIYKSWEELTQIEKAMAFFNYIAIREAEEQQPCSNERAEREAPFCRGYWVNKDGYVTCNI